MTQYDRKSFIVADEVTVLVPAVVLAVTLGLLRGPPGASEDLVVPYEVVELRLLFDSNFHSIN